jgi:hypothetical protein
LTSSELSEEATHSELGEVSVLVSPSTPTHEELERIANRGPIGALALCGIAVAIVAAIWFAFYIFAFLPRGLLR